MFLEENRANAKCSLLGAGGCALESESLEFKPWASDLALLTSVFSSMKWNNTTPDFKRES